MQGWHERKGCGPSLAGRSTIAVREGFGGQQATGVACGGSFFAPSAGTGERKADQAGVLALMKTVSGREQ
jgi:hypothetical protein